MAKTKLDYVRYCQAVDDFFARKGVEHMSEAVPKCETCEDSMLEDNVCPTCGETDSKEPYFSWRPCGCCGDSDGGNRQDYVAYKNSECDPAKWIEVSICEDCVYSNEYGTWPDMPMTEVNADVVTVKLKDGRVVKLDGEAGANDIRSSEHGLIQIADVDLDATEDLLSD